MQENMKVFIMTITLCICMEYTTGTIISQMTTADYNYRLQYKLNRIKPGYLNLTSCGSMLNLRSCQLALYDQEKVRDLAANYITRTQFSAVQRKRRAMRETRKRVKREIPGNPCRSGVGVEQTVIYATDFETGNIVELLHDPVNHVYQTFYIYDCQIFNWLSFLCQLQDIEFKATVFTGVNFEVEVRKVKFPTTCALRVEW
uniref:uncharacterized protein LOC113474217 isoform X2 n=1 Tax=Ciona intestinalis TaxID=7719 RepID=UPI000EF50B2E|nr:uncharacterized protein LOC113474217 isoform X2 [Ciona intestinalis]|eukprot:XP_026690192.1 uncharacterized protein LOC113474217 isoform X2 [Ciona intestinalis]